MPVTERAVRCRGRNCHTVRCGTRTRNGKGRQCKNRTTIYPDHCYLHTQKNIGLKIAKSDIPGAGNGLYTLKELKRGDLIGEYKGVKRQEPVESGYDLEMKKNTHIDASSTQSCIARYINDCRRENIDKGHCGKQGSNCAFRLDNKRKRVTVRATRKIRPGDELYVSYGTSYWKG